MRCARRRARPRADGFRRGNRTETVKALAARRRESRRSAGAPVSPVFGRAFPRRAARLGEAIAVLEQTKEPGAAGEPLYLDVVATLAQGFGRGQRSSMPRVIGGRYGLSSKDFTPGDGESRAG